MPTRFKKSRKLRGHVSAGHGRVGKHRKHPGGRGYAGAEHHHRINVFKYHPGYIGKHGQRRFHWVKNHHVKPTINVDKIWGLLSDTERTEFAEKKPIIDVTRAGYFKVLGAGLPLTRAMIIRAREFSKKAVDKITAAGGEAQLVSTLPPADA